MITRTHLPRQELVHLNLFDDIFDSFISDFFTRSTLQRSSVRPLMLENKFFSTTFPDRLSCGYPYSVLANPKNGDFEFQFALAGFSKTDIQVSFDENEKIIYIKGLKKVTQDEKPFDERLVVLRNGISGKEFSTSIKLAHGATDIKWKMEDGLLKITISTVKEEKADPIKMIPCQA